MHLVTSCHVALVLCWLGVHLGWRDRLSTPKSIGYFFMYRGFIGGRGIATLFLTFSVCTSSLTLRTTEEERSALLPFSSQCRGVLRKGGTGPLPHNVGKFLRGAVLARLGRFGDTIRLGRNGAAAQMGRSGDAIRLGRNGAAAQMGRSGDTMVCGLATTSTLLRVGTARDALRCHVMVCVVDHGLYLGSLRRYFPFSMRNPKVGLYIGGERQMLGRWRSDNRWSEQVGGGWSTSRT